MKGVQIDDGLTVFKLCLGDADVQRNKMGRSGMSDTAGRGNGGGGGDSEEMSVTRGAEKLVTGTAK